MDLKQIFSHFKQIFQQKIYRHKYRVLRKTQTGQVTFEFILILSMLVFFANGALNLIQDKNWPETLINKPWSLLSGMIESGVWEERNRAIDKHPVLFDPPQGRYLSVKGEDL